MSDSGRYRMQTPDPILVDHVRITEAVEMSMALDALDDWSAWDHLTFDEVMAIVADELDWERRCGGPWHQNGEAR